MRAQQPARDTTTSAAGQALPAVYARLRPPVMLQAFAVVAALWWAAGLLSAIAETRIVATAASLRVISDTETEFRLDLTAAAPVEITTFADPDRVVVEFANTSLRLDRRVEPAAGLISGIRFEDLPDDRVRVIISSPAPVTVRHAGMAALGPASGAQSGVQLVIAIAKVEQDHANAAGVSAPVAERASAAVKPAMFDDVQPGAEVKAKPVIVIDPGHGGIDPGAIGGQKITEKAVVLAVARELKAALSAGGRYDVRMTRADDVFIPLDSRVEFSRQAKADLFISLHADAIDNGSLARAIHGASIYTLSEKASDEQARLMADKENAADLVAGIGAATVDGGEGVKGILYDLMNRETAAFTRLLSHSIAEALGKSGGLAREPERAAAFRVLKQAHAPSVLIELGFLSNPDEEQRMAGPAWQKQTARALAQAVDAYFAIRTAADQGQWVQAVPTGRLPP